MVIDFETKYRNEDVFKLLVDIILGGFGSKKYNHLNLLNI